MIRKAIAVLMLSAGCAWAQGEGEWISLFDGATLTGWKAAENPDSFRVEDGLLVAHGPRAHLFYTGPDGSASFTDFEFEAEVQTLPKANSGIYFHTRYQESGWPGAGYEAQVNCSHSDARKTGGLYAVQDVMNEAPHADGEWFHYRIRVEGKRIQIWIDGEQTVDYTEPADLNRPDRQLGEGTFAIQAHDPESRVLYRNLRVRRIEGGFTNLFNGRDLSGWVRRGGEAKFEVEDGAIVGHAVPRTPNSFLCTEKDYGDFILEFEYLGHATLNSGVQVRSHSKPDYHNGRVHGYQCELEQEGRDRNWSCGIYDEGRAGWLYPASDKPQQEQAFREQGAETWKNGEWNHIRIEARGDRIRTWLNGVARADLDGLEDRTGFIGLQVHGVGDSSEPMSIRWRNMRIREL